MPTAPIAMAPDSERPPMIVSAGYFRSRRAPSFPSSHETSGRGARPDARDALPTAVIWRHPTGAPEPAARKPDPHSWVMLSQIYFTLQIYLRLCVRRLLDTLRSGVRAQRLRRID